MTTIDYSHQAESGGEQNIFGEKCIKRFIRISSDKLANIMMTLRRLGFRHRSIAIESENSSFSKPKKTNFEVEDDLQTDG